MSEKKGFFAKLAAGLSKTRNNVAGVFEDLFTASELDEDFYDSLEEALIMADVGMETTNLVTEQLRAAAKEQKIKSAEEARAILRGIISDMMRAQDPFCREGEKLAILVVGVNGVGKTTTIGKLSNVFAQQGRKVILAAADTFRAAAAEQLMVWGQRAGVPVIKHGEGADPAAVVFDAIGSAKAKNADILIVDTAGRLHNKKNLMEELRKIGRVLEKEYPGVRQEVLLVLDATTGQNGLAQAKIFGETVPLTGIVLTKLDGTAKGGVAIAVRNVLGIPVRFVGVGEGIDDLQEFIPEDYAEALF